MDNNQKEPQRNGGDKANEQTKQSLDGTPKKEAVQDIFAASANPNVRLTPVDPKPASDTTDRPRIELADSKPTPTPATPPSPTPQPQAPRKRKTNKVMALMIVAIVVVLIFGASFVVFQLLTSSDGAVSTTEVTEETASVEQPTPLDESEFENQLAEIPLDTDKDGLSDEREVELGLDIHSADTDGDGLSDKDEVDIYSTDPFNTDSDGDGFTDGSEVSRGFDPIGPGRLNDITRGAL